MKAPREKGRKSRELVLLKDLVPKRDPMGGGSAKPVFGEGSSIPRATGPGSPGKGPGKKK